MGNNLFSFVVFFPCSFNFWNDSSCRWIPFLFMRCNTAHYYITGPYLQMIIKCKQNQRIRRKQTFTAITLHRIHLRHLKQSHTWTHKWNGKATKKRLIKAEKKKRWFLKKQPPNGFHWYQFFSSCLCIDSRRNRQRMSGENKTKKSGTERGKNGA